MNAKYRRREHGAGDQHEELAGEPVADVLTARRSEAARDGWSSWTGTATRDGAAFSLELPQSPSAAPATA